jgi:imidazolonepropionase-like amidohydrolase
MFPLVNNSAPLYFEVDSKEHIERLLKLKDEFGFDVVIVSGMEAYGKAEELSRRNIPVLASIDFMDAPGWYADQKKTDDNEEEASEEELTEEEYIYREKQLEAWKAHVSNIKILMEAGVKVGYASAGLDLSDLPEKLKVLLDEGELFEEDIVALMTTNTAEILGISGTHGTLATGKTANFSVYDKPMAEEKAKVMHNISNGIIYEFNGN